MDQYRYFLWFSYNGTRYHGWQRQTGSISVQEELEKALSKYFTTEISVVGAGRTDTGVHARQMVCHFNASKNIISSKKDSIYHLNCILPHDIALSDIRMVKADAHARFDAVERTYVYQISTVKDPFRHLFYLEYFLPLDFESMNKACEYMLEYTDFESFAKLHSDVKTFECKIKEAHWQKENDALYFTITADRFLRNMVRAIVGTMIDIGRGRIQACAMHDIIQAKSRSASGTSVPAKGLHLINVRYDDSIFL